MDMSTIVKIIKARDYTTHFVFTGKVIINDITYTITREYDNSITSDVAYTKFLKELRFYKIKKSDAGTQLPMENTSLDLDEPAPLPSLLNRAIKIFTRG